MSRNEELFARAQTVIPGGVNSPVRSFRSVGGTPFFVASAQGSTITDADGSNPTTYDSAMTGVQMRSSASERTRMPISSPTSAMMRSAPQAWCSWLSARVEKAGPSMHT